jgi:ATP-dependent Lhr-like helicase
VVTVDAPSVRPLDLELVVPVENMAEPAPPDPLDPDQTATRSIWPAVYPRLVELVQSHSSTIIFANSRRLAERICSEINLLAGKQISRAHHGSVAREQRVQIEEALKRGDLKAVVATSSLELGIDMGSVDLVIQVEAPPSVASGLQRVGRSGHHVGGVSRAKLFPKYRGDLLVATVISRQMAEGKIEDTRLPRNPLDVLAQQLVATVAVGERTVDDLYSMVVGAASFAELSRSQLESTLDMLAGRYPSDLFAELRPRLVWDRITGVVTARPGSRQLAIANPGTIPDRGLFRVVLPDGSRVGELDEEMVYESRQGDLFILGASTWRISEISAEKVVVVPAPGEPAARLPFWKGDALGRPVATGREVGRFLRKLRGLSAEQAFTLLTDDYRLDELAARNLIAYVAEEMEATGGILPTDQTIVVQRFRDEIGDWRVVILSTLGARVHAPWAMAVTHKLRSRYGTDVDVIWADDGIAFRFPDADQVPQSSELIPEPDEVNGLLLDHLADTAQFAARFREAAGRALLLPRRRPGGRTPLWQRRRRAADLLAVARQFADFPIVLETYREILQDDFDLPALIEILSAIRSRRMRVAEVETHSASPFASSLLFAFVAGYLYEADAPLAERRAAALTLDRKLLAELLGEAELRDLISPEVLATIELELQHLTMERKVSGPEGLADLLRGLGPMTRNDLDVRSSDPDLEGSLLALEESHRVVRVLIGGEERWAAIEDASRLRDALGVQPPPGVPFAFLQPVADPLADVVGRFARTHGPFSVNIAAGHLGLPIAVVESVLRRLESQGRVVRGAFRPGGDGFEWVDVEVLRRLKRRSLSILRREIEPVEQAALGRFLPAWQRATGPLARGRLGLVEHLKRLQGAEIPASVLERDVLATRVDQAGPQLDGLMLAGDLVWAGRGSLGPRDGRIALYFREALPRLWHPALSESPQEEIHHSIRRHLQNSGASFFREIYAGAGGGDPLAVLEGLWDLAWAGEVTNDTLAPVRAYLSARSQHQSGRPALTSSFPPHASGRWSLLTEMTEGSPSTAQSAARAEQLLDRHGVLTRSTVAAEDCPGGFSGLYPILSHMEEAGRLRRGYFVEGLGGAQFALPGAVDRLREKEPPGLVSLAATDPANPYGAALPWPDDEESRPARTAGAYVLLESGRLVGYIDRARHRLSLFDSSPDLVGPLGRELAAIASRHRRFIIETVNDKPAPTSSLAPALTEWGFAVALRGLAYRG